MKEKNIFATQQLDAEEQALNDSLERGEWVSVKNNLQAHDEVIIGCDMAKPGSNDKSVVTIEYDYFLRLKKLESNIKECIAGLESELACHLASSDETKNIQNVKELLENLYEK